MYGLAILLGFNLIGMALSKWAGVPLPGNVIGLILFTGCLFAGIVKLQWVEGAAGFLLHHMLLFFAPVVVGVIAYESLLKREWLSVTCGLVGATAAYLAFDGFQAATINWQSFTQVAFEFLVTPRLLVLAIITASVIGLIGGLFPALRAVRLPIAAALREL